MTSLAQERSPTSRPAIEDLLSQLEASRAANRAIDHRAANSLQMAAAFLTLQQRSVENDEARAILEQASLRIGAIARAHRHFYVNSTEGDVELSGLLTNLCEDLETRLGVTCRTDMELLAVPARMATRVVLVVNELVTNARRHAYGDGAGGVVAVTLQARDGHLRVTVADRGPGLADGFDPREATGVGLTVVRAAVAQLGGELSTHVDGGAWFTVTVPLP